MTVYILLQQGKKEELKVFIVLNIYMIYMNY